MTCMIYERNPFTSYPVWEVDLTVFRKGWIILDPVYLRAQENFMCKKDTVSAKELL